jgi:hypothetical protein
MLGANEITFRLEASNDPKLNWELAETLDLDITDEDKVLLRKNGEALEKSFFHPVYQKQVNGLGKGHGLVRDQCKQIDASACFVFCSDQRNLLLFEHKCAHPIGSITLKSSGHNVLSRFIGGDAQPLAFNLVNPFRGFIRVLRSAAILNQDVGLFRTGAWVQG